MQGKIGDNTQKHQQQIYGEVTQIINPKASRDNRMNTKGQSQLLFLIPLA
jgi:hypothetical protein